MSKTLARVLVVDDESSIREIFARALGSDYEVIVAGSGEEAVKIAGREPFDILLVDHRMGGMDGIQTFREIREINPNVVSILISGSLLEDSEKVKEAKEEGFFALLAKPISVAQVRQVVENAQQAVGKG